MSSALSTCTPGRRAGATVAGAWEIAGARHEILPPRMAGVGAVVLYRSARRAPPP